MIEVKLFEIKKQSTSEATLLSDLNAYLEKTKFFGTITLKYEQGDLRHIRAEQTFTVDSLISHLNA